MPRHRQWLPRIAVAALCCLTSWVSATGSGYPPPPGPYRIGPIETQASPSRLYPGPLLEEPSSGDSVGSPFDANTLFGAPRPTPLPSATLSNRPTNARPTPAFVDRPDAAAPGAAPQAMPETAGSWRSQPRPPREPVLPSQSTTDARSADGMVFRPADRQP